VSLERWAKEWVSMPILETDDGKISYEEYGSGPVALLLHGSPGNAQSWARVGVRLAERYRVVAPDLPGYGETPPQAPEEAPDVGYTCTLLERLIRHVGAPAVLAGHSYGGVVALAVALRSHVSVGALALFEPVALPVLLLTDAWESFHSAQAVFDDYAASFAGGNTRAIQRMIDFWFGAGAFDRLPEAVSTALVQATATNIHDVRATLRERYTPEAFHRLSMPVVTIVGERSPAITHQIARIITAHAPSGSLVQIERANHALTTTHVDAVVHTLTSLTMPAASPGTAGDAPPRA
jgi:pimeloyl-ACP methyl ester carboxylesterase